MHPKFADWYRQVDIVPSEDRLDKRWAAVEKLSASITLTETLELVRILYSRPLRNQAFLDKFRGLFKEEDTAFAMHGNNLEISVLAGAAIANLLVLKKRPLDLVVALGMTCANYQGHRQTEVSPDFLSLAQQYLADESAALRGGLAIVSPKFKPVTEIRITAELPVLQTGLTELMAETRDFREGAATGLVRLAARQSLLAEELNILWWVFGGYSRDLGRPFRDIPFEAVPLVAGKELADLIEILPGPASSRAILARTMLAARDAVRSHVSVLEAVRSITPDWIAGWSGRPEIASCADICVTLMAAQRSLETPGSDAWTTGVDNITGVSVRVALEPLTLATQVYDEHRLCKSIEKSR